MLLGAQAGRQTTMKTPIRAGPPDGVSFARRVRWPSKRSSQVVFEDPEQTHFQANCCLPLAEILAKCLHGCRS